MFMNQRACFSFYFFTVAAHTCRCNRLLIDFEFTSRDTPQHNNLAELAFPYLVGKARAMMGGAQIPLKERGKMALEAIGCATQLDGLVTVTLNGKLATCNMHVFRANSNEHAIYIPGVKPVS